MSHWSNWLGRQKSIGVISIPWSPIISRLTSLLQLTRCWSLFYQLTFGRFLWKGFLYHCSDESRFSVNVPWRPTINLRPLASLIPSSRKHDSPVTPIALLTSSSALSICSLWLTASERWVGSFVAEMRGVDSRGRGLWARGQAPFATLTSGRGARVGANRC